MMSSRRRGEVWTTGLLVAVCDESVSMLVRVRKHLGDILKNLLANFIWFLLTIGAAGLISVVLLALRADPAVLIAGIAVTTLAAIVVLLLLSRRRPRPTNRGRSNVVLRVLHVAPEEPWLEWLHLEAENIGSARAEGAWIRIRFFGGLQTWRLVWTGAHEKIDLEPGLPVQIPLVIRANEAGHAVYGVPLEAGDAWLTDVTFLKDHRATHLLRGARDEYATRIDVTVLYGDRERTEASFNLSVRRDARMTLYQIN